MNSKTTKLKIIILFLALIALTSCIGTVKDKNSHEGDILQEGVASTGISFSGLVQANPISHNKVELYFFPAKGDQNNFTYEVYINGSPIASKLSGKALPVNSKGMMSTVINNLSINTTYTFNMKAIESGTSASSTLDPSKALSATTFANETADFQGISSLVLSAGEAGRTTAIVSWLSATTRGSAISPKPTDPVAYEVRYISQLGGINNLNNNKYTGPDRVIIQNPDTLTTSPSLSSQTSMTINGLNPGTTYYFQVRAIHKNYALYGSDKSYKSEANTKYLYVKTLDSSGVFDFATNQVILTNPIGEDGLTKLNASWLPASGAFNHYRVCFTKVAEANVSPELVPIDDHLVDTVGLPINDCIIKNSDDTFHQLISLDSYAYYQVKIVACKNAVCDFGNRIMSDIMQRRVYTNVAPFAGILSFENPKDESTLNNIKMNFDPAVTSAGFINQFRLYCYSDINDPSPVRIDNRSFPTAGTGKSNCNGITLQTIFPSTTQEFSSFNNIELSLADGGIDGIKKYCFSLVPTIDSVNLTQSDVTNSVVKCFIPQIKTPNILQFPGRLEVYTVINKDIQITWPTPTGGLYSKFIVFYQEKITGAEFFDFQAAINEYTASAPDKYRWVDNIDKALNSQNILGLVPGSKYNIGVLPYLNYNSTKLWGQFNYNTGECSLPLPKAKFKEWMQIFAIGPKEDGLTPVDQLSNHRYILETINADDQPVEIKTTVADIKVPEPTDPLASTKTGSLNFDGIYGKYNSLSVNPLHQYSNSGIVKIMWQDVSLYNDTEVLNAYMDTGASKYNRKYGYRIYRSDDNKLTWSDLTAKGSANPNQSPLNAGLVQTWSYAWKKRNNDASNNTVVSGFTDYSVKFSGISGEIDRARVYYYKIVPVFNGKELLYDDNTNPNHHIIKVVLPPRNMALVNRMMANKTICQEMDLSLKKQDGDFYSCDFDGVGSKGLNPPFAIGSTVYDSGGDLLIDRFELGAPFTRGDPSTSNSNSDYLGTKLDFKGRASNGLKFAGCFNDTNVYYEPNQGAGLGSGTYAYQNLIPGDCIGRDVPIYASDRSTPCSDPTTTSTEHFIFPGSNGLDVSGVCNNSSFPGLYLTDLSKNDSLVLTNNSYAQTQGEFASLYFIRNGDFNYNSDSKTLFNIPAGNNKVLIPDTHRRLPMTFVNLPYFDNSNIMHPRWLPINRLFGNFSSGAPGTSFSSASAISLYDKTIAQILSSELYDSTSVFAPANDLTNSYRYNKTTTPLARLISSNASKLPPLQGLSHTQFHKVCSTYKIQIGIETGSLGYRSISGTGTLEKRLMRKKESTVAAAWPVNWDNAKVTGIEKGTDASNMGCNGPSKATPNGTSTLSKNSSLDNYIPWAGSTIAYSLTGSKGNNSSEKCTSKFGVQDLAGNISELNSDMYYCNYLSPDPSAHKPSIYIGDPLIKDVNHSVKYNSNFHYDFVNAQPWVSGFADSGTCSAAEIGGAHSGNYTTSGALNSIYLPDSNIIDSLVITKTKSFDQGSVLASRNGDGSFLDFGINNLGPILNGPDAFNITGLYFNVPLGIPLGCTNGCASGSGGNNKLVASDFHAALPGSVYQPDETPIQNFPVNNSVFTNYGVEDITKYNSASTNDEGLSFPFQYVSGVNDTGISANNTLSFTTINSASPVPGNLYKYYFKVDRNSPMRFSTGGSAKNESGRYSFFMDGPNDIDDRALSDRGTRCAVMVEEE